MVKHEPMISGASAGLNLPYQPALYLVVFYLKPVFTIKNLAILPRVLGGVQELITSL